MSNPLVLGIVLKPSPAQPRGWTWDTADLGLEPGRVKEKTGEGKTWCDPAKPATRLTRKYPGKNSVAIC